MKPSLRLALLAIIALPMAGCGDHALPTTTEQVAAPGGGRASVNSIGNSNMMGPRLSTNGTVSAQAPGTAAGDSAAAVTES